MIDGILSGELYKVLEKALNASSMQQRAIGNNIANVNTPGFKASEVVFQNKLDRVINSREADYLPIKTTHEKHIPIEEVMTLDMIRPEIITRNETAMRNDDNNVDIDAEMAKMAENTAYYSALAQITSAKLEGLRRAISEGRQ